MYKNTILAVLVALSFSAIAGDKGNGGYSVVCRNDDGTIASAELLDIYEGRLIHNLNYTNNSLTVAALLSAAQYKVLTEKSFSDKFIREIRSIHSNLVFIPEGNVLESTEDALPSIKKKDCQFEQLANYTDNGEIIVTQEIYDHLDNLNKAALVVHEAVYAIRRKALGESTSVASRKLTAYLMADKLKYNEQVELDRLITGSLQRPEMNKRPCGLTGPISERIENCSYQEKSKYSLVLVTRTPELEEVYKDLATGLVWSDRLPSKMNLTMADKACRSSDLSQKGHIKGSWRLPTVEEYGYASERLLPILPGMYGDDENYWFWTSTTRMNFALVYKGAAGERGYEYIKSNKTGSVRCVLQD